MSGVEVGAAGWQGAGPLDGVGVSTGVHGYQVWVQKCTWEGETHSLLQDRKDVVDKERDVDITNAKAFLVSSSPPCSDSLLPRPGKFSDCSNN